jgi:hypothetical protein
LTLIIADLLVLAAHNLQKPASDFLLPRQIQSFVSQPWAEPWVVPFEYGGVGEPHRAMTDTGVLAEQVPRLYGMVHDGS